MPKRARNKPNAIHAQNKKVSPVQVLTRILGLVGKPIYFVLSHLALAIIFAFYQTGRLLKFLSFSIIQIIKVALKKVRIFLKQKREEKVKTGIKKGLVKKRLLTIRFPNIGNFIKIEELKISLLELKIISRIRSLFVRKISRFQKIKIRKRVGFLVLILGMASIAFYFYFSIIRDLPSPNKLTERDQQVSTKIYDRNGTLLYKIYKDQNRTIVPLSQIPVHVRLATLAAEDAEFYDHPGFSVRGMGRALVQDLQTRSLRGGSTITQQLVKNVLLTPEKTITRKIKEIVLSVEVEANYTKDQILEMYLNQVSFGGTAYGIEEASEQYFGKDVGRIDLAEAAYLAGLTKSPTQLSPYGQNPEAGFERQREVLHLMVINKFITEDQEITAEKERLIFIPNKSGIQAPHFVMYIRQLLVDKYGEDMVDKGGLEVTTSLDLPTEELAEQIVKEEVGSLKSLNVGNGAALVVSPQTGEILAMVGSADYFDTGHDGNVNVTLRLRQPGSSIKVVNYAYALSHDFTPATIINDSPITYITPGTTPYSPVNYDGKYRGNISLRSALAESRNIPAVKVLASYGVPNMVTEGQLMGITSWTDPSKFGLSLTLGGGAVTALDLATVYSTIADGGKRPDLTPILQVKDYKGKVLLARNASQGVDVGEKVLDPRVAFMLTDILKDNAARAPEFGLNSYLVIKNHPEVAVKTGTSNDLRDNWTVGFNQNYLVLTWVGNNDNSPMSRIASGVTGASPIWNKIMSTLLQDQPSVDWKVPDKLVRINCPGKSEWFKEEKVPANFCQPINPIVAPNASPNPILDTGVTTTRP